MKSKSFVCVALGCFALASSAWAINPYDLLHRTIPASACSPLDSVQAAKVRLQQGAWRFDGASTSTVSFYCPIPINAFPADLEQGFGTDMEFFRVWYRDSDGTGVFARVTARLSYRNLAGAWLNSGNLFDSNTFADMFFARGLSA